MVAMHSSEHDQSVVKIIATSLVLSVSSLVPFSV